MRIPLPDRLAPRSVGIFMTILFVGQLITGTDLVFAVLTALFVAIWAFGFNAAGGIGYPSGACIFFIGLLTAIVGLSFKVLLLQPGERNLHSPRSTMLVYCIGMAGMAVAGAVARSLRAREPFVKDFDSLELMRQACIACVVLSLVSPFFLGNSLTAGGSLISALRQINRFTPMNVLLGTVYELRVSNGRRSTNWMVNVSLVYIFAFGLLFYSKEGMLLGPTAWFLAAAFNNYNFSRVQIISAVAGMSFMVYYLVPYSQLVRTYTTPSKTENLAIAIRFLSDLPETRRTYYAALSEVNLQDEPHLFDQRIALLDRAVMMPPDDALIDFTNKGNVFGLLPTLYAYGNVVPHFIWPGKPVYNTGNIYAHELGQLAEEDESTGISFSPFGDAYHQAKWLGLLILLPIDMFISFIIMDSVVGSARYSPWPLLWVLEASHVAPEGGLNAPVYFATYGLLAMLVLVWTLKKAVPFVLARFRRPPPVSFDRTEDRRPNAAQPVAVPSSL